MKSIVILIVVAGLAAAGWMNRDQLSGLWAHAAKTLGVAALTPHPAREAQAQVMARYPRLKVANSPLNRKFIALYKETQSSNPALLSHPDWPLRLAEQAMNPAPDAPSRRAAPSVVIYTTSRCSFCVKAKQYLTQKGVRYEEVNIEQSSAGQDDYRRLGGDGVPLIMVGDNRVDGFDRAELDRLLL